MKYFNRALLMIILAGLIMAPQTSQVNSYVNGNVLTADQLNSEFGNIYSTINGLDEDNFLSTTSIDPAFIAATVDGSGITRAIDGSLSVNPDNSTIEINSDLVRIKNSGVTSAKILDGAIATADIGTVTVTHDLGTLTAPSMTFTGDTNTGIFSPAADNVALTTGGESNLLAIYDGANRSVRVPSGSAAVPGLAFLGDLDTGLHGNANVLSFDTGGVNRANLSSAGLSTTVGIAAGGGGFLHWKVITIGTSSATSGTISTAHGLTLANILSILGSQATSTQLLGPSVYGTSAAPSTNSVSFFADATSIFATFSGAPGVSKTFKAIIYYQ